MVENTVPNQVFAKYQTLAEYEQDKTNLPELSIAFIEEMIYTDVLNKAYPIGCIYETTTDEHPGVTFGMGEWEEYGKGKVTVAKSTDTEFDTIGKAGGDKTVMLSTAQMPGHTHSTPNHTHTINTTQIRGSITPMLQQSYQCSVENASGVLSSARTMNTRWLNHSSDRNNVAGGINLNADHNHSVASSGGSTSGSTGNGGSHNNLQPYIVVYRWRRIA